MSVGWCQVALLNSMYGNGGDVYGTRHIRGGRVNRRALLEGGAPSFVAGGPKARRGAARKSNIKCKACGQVRLARRMRNGTDSS